MTQAYQLDIQNNGRLAPPTEDAAEDSHSACRLDTVRTHFRGTC